MKTLFVLLAVLLLTGCSGVPYKTVSGAITGALFGGSTSPSAITGVGHTGYIPQQPGGIARYGADQATGPVINGVHHGIPAGPPRVTCHGAILNGQCTGPEF